MTTVTAFAAREKRILMDRERERYELIDSIFRRSVVTYRSARASLEGKAKTTLTAGAIVLGIVMGGLGTVAGLSGGAAPADWQFLESLPPRAAIFIAACFIASLVAIFLSVVLAVSALKVTKIRGFGAASAFGKGKYHGIDTRIVADWLSAKTYEVYKKVYEAYAVELGILEEQCDHMGRRTRQSQWSLVVGLALSLVWASAVIGIGVASQSGAAP